MRCLIILLLLTGCAPLFYQPGLSVYHDFISLETLASYIVGTPDPSLACPDRGERLTITWNFPPCDYPVDIKLTVRFVNKEEVRETLKAQNHKGSYTFYLLNEKFFCTGGIETYLIQAFHDDCLLEEWVHQLWTPLIQFSEDKKKLSCT